MEIFRRFYACLHKKFLLTLISLIRFYQLAMSPFLVSVCRFYPSCSEYALNSINSHGIVTGLFLIAKRILRCHPGCRGGFDPVP